MIPQFYYHPRMLGYDFGPRHPLKPMRLERAVALLEDLGNLQPIDPGKGMIGDVLRVHGAGYVEAVRSISSGVPLVGGQAERYGFGSVDNPPFPGMFEASLAYVAGSARAAEAVRGGEPLAFGLAGGLHHAQREKASGFCIFNDAAIAIDILRERFSRVAYVDIDLHHGDGVQWLFYDDPTVLTCSIHETGRSLYPGTGFVEETGATWTSLNVPLVAHTTGDVWLWAFENSILPALDRFKPDAIVLQMGTDPHFSDPLGHLDVAAQEWLEAVKSIHRLQRPMVALGGGGYSETAVPRMWASAVLSLSGIAYDDTIPVAHNLNGHMQTFADPELPQPRGSGREEAERIVRLLDSLLLDNIPTP